MRQKDINRTNISPIKGAPHTHEITPPLLLLPPNKSRRYKNLVFCSPVTPSPITTSRISKSPQVRFLKRASTASLYTSLWLQIPCTHSLLPLHIYSTSNRRRIWSPVEHLRWSFSAEIVKVFRPSAVFAKELHAGCLT